MKKSCVDFPRLIPEIETRYLPSTDVADYKLPTEFPRLQDAKRISLDLETHDPTLNTSGPGVRRGGYIVGAAIVTDDGVAGYWPMRHVNGPNCDSDKVESWLRDELKDYKGELVGANISLYDGDFLQAAKIQPKQAKWRDIQWAEALLDELADSYGLDALAQKYLGLEKGTNELERIYGPDVMQHFREVHPAHATAYALSDARYPLEILDKQKTALQSEKLLDLYDLECRLTPFLLYLREKGVRVDLERAGKMEKVLAEKYQNGCHKLEASVGFEVDPFSGPSLAKAFEHLHLTYPLTEKGNPSFLAPWLKRHEHPFAQLLCETREYEKLRGTFVEGYIINGNLNSRIHCQFHPLRRADEQGERGTVSGRFSSTDPNLQNIPVRTELGRQIRECFIPENGTKWWSRDYSQIEYRLLVHYALRAKCQGAENAQKMYQDDPNTDFHAMVSDLTGIDRKSAKNLNFGLVYGMGAQKLAASLGLLASDGSPSPKALQIMSVYHAKAPFIKEIYTQAAEQASKKGFVKTILNRRSRFELYEPKYTDRGSFFTPLPYKQALAAYGKVRRAKTHKALNCVLQGSAADLMKKAMVDIWEAGLLAEGSPLTAHITVHDELDGSVEPGERGQRALRQVQDIMESTIPLKVPILTSGELGNNWAEAH